MADTVLDGDLILPEDLAWLDRDWWKWKQTRSIAGDGTTRIQLQQRQAGRPITLASQPAGGDFVADVPYSMVLALEQRAADAPGKIMSLSFWGGVYTVTWRGDDNEKPIEAEPVTPMYPPDPNDPFLVTIRLITV